MTPNGFDRPVKAGAQLYSVAEVATFLGLSTRTILNRIKDGRIQARLDGRYHRISGDALFEHIRHMPPSMQAEIKNQKP